MVELDGASGEEPYQFAAVYSVQFLWIRSRTPQMDPDVYDMIVECLEQRDYPLYKLEITLQPTQ